MAKINERHTYLTILHPYLLPFLFFAIINFGINKYACCQKHQKAIHNKQSSIHTYFSCLFLSDILE